MGGGMFSFGGLLRKACGMAGKFKFACLAVVSVVEYLKRIKQFKHKKTGVPCMDHPETVMNPDCTKRLRQSACSHLAVIFTQMGKFFSCREDEPMAIMLGNMADKVQDLSCKGKKMQECWMRNHEDYDYCEGGLYSMLSVKANGFNNGRFEKGKRKGKAKAVMMTKRPYHKDVMPKKAPTLKYVRAPMVPSDQVLKRWCKFLPTTLLGAEILNLGVNETNRDACSKINRSIGRTLPATW